MPIDASPSGTLDIENATLRSRNIASLTNMVAGNDVIRGAAAPTLEVYGDPSNDGGVLPTLEIVSNVEAAGSAFTRLTSNAGVFSIQSGTAGTADSKADIAFASIGGNTEHMRIKGSSGNVGIGTDGPLGLLHSYVEGNGPSYFYHTARSTGYSSSGLYVKTSTNGDIINYTEVGPRDTAGTNIPGIIFYNRGMAGAEFNRVGIGLTQGDIGGSGGYLYSTLGIRNPEQEYVNMQICNTGGGSISHNMAYYGSSNRYTTETNTFASILQVANNNILIGASPDTGNRTQANNAVPTNWFGGVNRFGFSIGSKDGDVGTRMHTISRTFNLTNTNPATGYSLIDRTDVWYLDDAVVEITGVMSKVGGSTNDAAYFKAMFIKPVGSGLGKFVIITQQSVDGGTTFSFTADSIDGAALRTNVSTTNPDLRNQTVRITFLLQSTSRTGNPAFD